MTLMSGLLLQAANPIGQFLEGILGNLLPPPAAHTAAAIVQWLLAGVLILVVVLVSMLYITWVERKVVGRMQDRLGPNRVGKFGLLQPFADMIKMLIKEDITPDAAHRWVYNLGALLVVPPALIVFAVVPASQHLLASDMSVGVLFFVAVSGTMVLPIFMAGWGSRNKYALLGAMRAVAQIVSYEIPQVLSLVGVLLLAGTLSMQALTYSQGPVTAAGQPSFPGVWYIWLQPVAFLIFILATAAEIERTPFDIPEAESEIIAGYHVEYSGLKFGMFYLALYFLLIAASALGAILFLGGWQPPVAALAKVGPLDLGWFWFGLKTLLLVMVFIWFRATWPRIRADQLMGFAWRILVPLSLANLLVAGLVGKITYDIQTSLIQQGVHSFQTSPWFVFLGFTLANVILIAVTIGLLVWWQGRQRAPAVAYSGPGASEGVA